VEGCGRRRGRVHPESGDHRVAGLGSGERDGAEGGDADVGGRVLPRTQGLELEEMGDGAIDGVLEGAFVSMLLGFHRGPC
jgi:hypothetical protein